MNLSGRPEEKLLSAVIALAVEDVCLPPIQITAIENVRDYEKKKKVVVLSGLAESAYNFLFCNGVDGYCAALDMDPGEFRIRLKMQLLDTKTNRPFDLSNKPNELTSRRKRMFRLNNDLFSRGQLRGNFKEAVSLKLKNKEEQICEF